MSIRTLRRLKLGKRYVVKVKKTKWICGTVLATSSVAGMSRFVLEIGDVSKKDVRSQGVSVNPAARTDTRHTTS